MNRFLATLLLSSVCLGVTAQDDNATGRPAESAETRSPLAFGVGGILSDSPYAGEGARFIPVPLISYEGERFFVRGVSAGFHLLDDNGVKIDLIGKYRFAAFEVDELGRTELAANGIDDRLLEDRDGGLDLGFAATWTGAAGELGLEVLADATDTSGGQEASFRYSYPFPVGYGRLSPSVGVTWMSEDLANYAYGTLPSEVARGVVDYRPGSVTLPELGLTFTHPLSRQWFFLGSLRYAMLPGDIERSPLIEDGTDSEASMMLFFTRGL